MEPLLMRKNAEWPSLHFEDRRQSYLWGVWKQIQVRTSKADVEVTALFEILEEVFWVMN